MTSFSQPEALKCAKLQQQEYYELLPDYTKYEKCHYKYLKQNIGFSLFGAPSIDMIRKSSTNDDLCQRGYIIDQMHYEPLLQRIIEKIYTQVCEFGEGMVEKECIYFAIIFNITYCSKNNSTKSQIDFQTTPIFKIKRIIINNDTKKTKYKNDAYEEYYIDAWARVYKSWADYKNNNVLPACIMVIPKNGFYQPDPKYIITEEYSTVWLEVLYSPECSRASNFINATDKAASVAGVVSLTLGIGSLFTPAALITMGAVATGAASGIWSVGRSVQNLVDRSTHEQSINITDRNALCSWLNIAGGVLSVTTTAGNILFTKAIKNGSNINNFMKCAYNTVVVSNLGVNGCGVAYNAYCLYEKYTNGEEITVYDVMSTVAHVLFFGNAVMNCQLARELIETTQGKVLDDYRATLRSKRLRKAYNKAKANAAANNSDTVTQNAEVISYIVNKTELQQNNNLQGNSKTNLQSTNKNKSQSNSGNSSKNYSQSNSKNNSQSTSKSNSQSNSNNSSKNNSQGTSKSNSQGNSNNSLKNNSQGTSKSNSQGNSNNSSKNNSQSTSKSNSHSNSNKSSKNNSQGTSKSNSQGNSNNSLKNNSQGTSKSNSQGNSNNSSKNNSQSTSKSNSQSNSNNSSKNNSYSDSSTPKNFIFFKNGNIIINDVVMIDPIKFVANLLKSDVSVLKDKQVAKSEDTNSSEMLQKLKNLAKELLDELFSKQDNNEKNIPDASKFNSVYEDMKHLKDGTRIFNVVFQIAICLAQYVGSNGAIYKAVYFVWCYVKECLLRGWNNTASFVSNINMERRIYLIITAFLEHMSCMVTELLPSFKVYIKAIN